MYSSCKIIVLWAAVACTSPSFNPKAFDTFLSERQLSNGSLASAGNLTVDLGYEIYQGVPNKTTGLNDYWGIRHAAPRTGHLRWQPPQLPAVNRNQVLPATTLAQNCPQSPPAPL